MEFGICMLSVVPVRADTTDKAEITTQLIFGDLIEIKGTSEDEKWVKVKVESDGYEGWVDKKQVFSLSAHAYFKLNSLKRLKTEEAISIVQTSSGEYLIPGGSTIYIDEQGKMNAGEEVALHGRLSDVQQKAPLEKLIKVAASYLNAPYLWGGKTHFGIDCSGFTQQVYGICGYKLPRDAWQQEQIGEPIDFIEAREGDLAYFKNSQGKIIHVGIVWENGQIIHASGQVRIDRLDQQGIFKQEINDYSHFLSSIKRIVL